MLKQKTWPVVQTVDRTDAVTSWIARDQRDLKARVVLLENQAIQDRKAIRGLLVQMEKVAPKDRQVIQALQDLLEQ